MSFSMRRLVNVAVLAAVVAVALAGCAPRRAVAPPLPPPTDDAAVGVAPPIDSPEAFAALAAREAALQDNNSWSLKGRMAVARGDDGGTLNVEWTQQGEAYAITLSAPVTGRQWRLSGTADSATLDGLDGGTRRGPDAETLLLDATGWRLPVRQMPAWVRGLRGPGPVAALAMDAEGRPVGFRQGEWALSYRDWWPGEPPLPRRVFAEAEGASVRLIVSEWQAPTPTQVDAPLGDTPPATP